ncbi:MAG TPA: hypothetical protein PKG90_11685 [Chitinophagaceae bacterium]|nr:hypothetical protein [Chitinophagaceae bacterium]HNU14866.1 hypothetical protein [Chitinophagaceae bacterium]
MTTGKNHITSLKWLHLIFGVVLVITFFLPWVAWKEIQVSAYHMAAGSFFQISESNFKLGNPFPQFAFTFYLFWLIPVLAIITTVLVLQNKKAALTAFLAGAMTLSLVTVFYLFTNTLIDLGVGNNAFSMLQPAAFISIVSAIGFILTALPIHGWLKKIIWLVIGPALAFSAYKIGESYVMSETFSDTEDLKADYTINATDLIREFAVNDSASNNKYKEKILTVNGIVSEAIVNSDSSVNIKFVDTAKYFINFPLEKNDYERTKDIRPGDAISLKGSLSGSSYSMILDSTSIDFKRSTLNKTKF